MTESEKKEWIWALINSVLIHEQEHNLKIAKVEWQRAELKNKIETTQLAIHNIYADLIQRLILFKQSLKCGTKANPADEKKILDKLDILVRASESCEITLLASSYFREKYMSDFRENYKLAVKRVEKIITNTKNKMIKKLRNEGTLKGVVSSISPLLFISKEYDLIKQLWEGYNEYIDEELSILYREEDALSDYLFQLQLFRIEIWSKVSHFYTEIDGPRKLNMFGSISTGAIPPKLKAEFDKKWEKIRRYRKKHG